jgi:hypothetical protein
MAAIPVHEIRLGSVRASIWQESDAAGVRYSVSISRTADGVYQRTNGRFEVDDLPVVAEVMDLAHLWIFEQAELIA